jgi:hypothetical protein
MVSIDVYLASITRPDGSEVDAVVARGMDGKFWIEASFLGLNQTDLKGIWDEWPGSVHREARSGRVDVETGAFVAQCSSAEKRNEVTRVVNDMRSLMLAKYRQ